MAAAVNGPTDEDIKLEEIRIQFEEHARQLKRLLQEVEDEIRKIELLQQFRMQLKEM